MQDSRFNQYYFQKNRSCVFASYAWSFFRSKMILNGSKIFLGISNVFGINQNFLGVMDGCLHLDVVVWQSSLNTLCQTQDFTSTPMQVMLSSLLVRISLKLYQFDIFTSTNSKVASKSQLPQTPPIRFFKRITFLNSMPLKTMKYTTIDMFR